MGPAAPQHGGRAPGRCRPGPLRVSRPVVGARSSRILPVLHGANFVQSKGCGLLSGRVPEQTPVPSWKDRPWTAWARYLRGTCPARMNHFAGMCPAPSPLGRLSRSTTVPSQASTVNIVLHRAQAWPRVESARMHGSTGRSGYPSDSSRSRWSRGRKLTVRQVPLDDVAPADLIAPSRGPEPDSLHHPRRAVARPLSPAPGASASRLPRRAGARPLPSAPGASASRLPRRAGARPIPSTPGASASRLPRRAGARPIPSTPGASASHLPRRAGARPLPSAPGASASRLPRRAGARPLSSTPGASASRHLRRAGVRTRKPSRRGGRSPFAARGGPELDRYRRRLVPVHHASCGGPESARLPPRSGPESHATAAGRCPPGHTNKGGPCPDRSTRAEPNHPSAGTGTVVPQPHPITPQPARGP
jgi:hypothetical protein